MRSDGDGGEEPLPQITQLFDEYLASREGCEEGKEEKLLERAGADRKRLEQRIETYRRLESLAGGREADDEVPRQVGRFQILARIGSGGLGRVYLALDPELGRQVAVKVLDPSLVVDQRERDWVLNEARSLARLEHPGVVRVFEVGSTPVHDWVVMEYLPGPSLAAVIHELRRMREETYESGDGKLDPRRTDTHRVAKLLAPFNARTLCLRRLASALAYCHDRGVLHRDIKPSNVIFDEKDEPRLIDFGLAHLSDRDEESKLGITGQLVGTSAFIAPEQVESGMTGADPRSDQFSFAAVAYELLTLESAFLRSTRTTTLDAITLAAPRAPRRIDATIPQDLERIVLHGLERERNDRYPDLTALAADLDAVLEHRPISITESSAVRIGRLWLRRHRRRVIVALAVVGLLLAAAIAQWGFATSGSRRGIVERLESTSPDSLVTPSDFEDRLDQLGGLRDEARRFDEGFWRATLLGTVGDLWQENAEAVAVRLGERIEQVQEEAATEGIEFQTGTWRDLIVLESRLLPDFPHNADLRARGLVELECDPGADVTLYQLDFLDGPGPLIRQSWFRPIAREARPVSGHYRFVVRDRMRPDWCIEVPFVVDDGWSEAQRLRANPPRAELLARSVRLPRALISTTHLTTSLGELLLPLLDQPDDEPGLVMPSVRILREVVTRGEFRRFLEATGGDPRTMRRTDAPDSEPVWVTGRSALEYARWAGGRLPSVNELTLGEARGVLALRFPPHLLSAPEPPPPGLSSWVAQGRIRGEWLCNMIPDGRRDGIAFAGYSTIKTARARGDLPIGALSTLGLDDHETMRILGTVDGEPIMIDAGIGFRVIFPADSPYILDNLLRTVAAPPAEEGGN
jgi:serine/threonine protein kinase